MPLALRHARTGSPVILWPAAGGAFVSATDGHTAGHLLGAAGSGTDDWTAGEVLEAVRAGGGPATMTIATPDGVATIPTAPRHGLRVLAQTWVLATLDDGKVLLLDQTPGSRARCMLITGGLTPGGIWCEPSRIGWSGGAVAIGDRLAGADVEDLDLRRVAAGVTALVPGAANGQYAIAYEGQQGQPDWGRGVRALVRGDSLYIGGDDAGGDWRHAPWRAAVPGWGAGLDPGGERIAGVVRLAD